MVGRRWVEVEGRIGASCESGIRSMATSLALSMSVKVCSSESAASMWTSVVFSEAGSIG